MDIYFRKEWGEACRFIENGIPKEFVFENEYGKIRNMFMLRKIPIAHGGKTYYDIITPYGYGGPLILSCKENQKENLLNAYEEAFGKYCSENNIVSEFVRFHPIENNALDFKRIYNAKYDRHTVCTDLTVSDVILQEFSKSARKNVKRAIKQGVSYHITEHPKDVSEFIKIYYSTMDRDGAGNFFYFPEEYFQACIDLFGKDILYVQADYEGKTIAAGFYIRCGDVIHAHLSGTLKEYLHLSPAYVIKYATAIWGKEHGCRLVHYGGGSTADENNTLYQFKRKFTREFILDFYVGRKVWNQKVYDEMVCQKNPKNTDFFPLYRSE